MLSIGLQSTTGRQRLAVRNWSSTTGRPHNNYGNGRMDKDWASPKYSGFREFVRRGKEPGTQTASEKVASTVATFLPKDGDGFQVPGTQMASEKVASTVATFLQRMAMASKYQALKWHQKR
jgi:hypothetical protein